MIVCVKKIRSSQVLVVRSEVLMVGSGELAKELMVGFGELAMDLVVGSGELVKVLVVEEDEATVRHTYI